MRTSNKDNVYIFLMWNDNEIFLKIGVSKDPVVRASCISRFSDYKAEVVYSRKTYSREQSIVIENDLHEKLKSHIYTPAYKFGGYTECFSLEAIETLYKGRGNTDILIRDFMVHCNTIFENSVDIPTI